MLRYIEVVHKQLRVFFVGGKCSVNTCATELYIYILYYMHVDTYKIISPENNCRFFPQKVFKKSMNVAYINME